MASSQSSVSRQSIDRPHSERFSPLPPSYHVEILSPGFRPGTHAPDPGQVNQKPFPGEIRAIHIEKSSEQLGIKIEEVRPGQQTAGVGGAVSRGHGSSGGVFVSSVSSNSLADQAGLQVGDQLLEVCGINLRMANFAQAATVLQRVGDSIDIKVQFNPDKYHDKYNTELIESDEEEESSEDDDDNRGPPPVPMRRSSPSRSGSPTPRNSPKISRSSTNQPPPLPPSSSSLRSSMQQHQHPAHPHHHHRQPQSHDNNPGHPGHPPPSYREAYHEPRLVYPVMKKSTDLGVRLVGGNAVGIFIDSVDTNSPAFHVGLRCADQILEYNGTDLRHAPAEQAAYELAKPADSVAILVQFNPDRYNNIKDQPGDSYFVKAMFDRMIESGDPLMLKFQKDDILYIDNTMYNGVPGQWSAWLVDQEGQKGTWGVIPSKYKVEEELLLKGRTAQQSDIDSDTSRRSSTSTRRSFFKRRKAGRSSSRDSKELASYIDMPSLLSYSDSGTLHEDPQINSYIRVEKSDYLHQTRPILILGPLADAVVDKLISDYPHKFVRCQPEYMTDCDTATLEKGVLDNMFVDFKRRGSHYEVTTVSSIKDICEEVNMNIKKLLFSARLQT